MTTTPPTPLPTSPLGMTHAAFTAAMASRGVSRPRATDLYRMLMRDGVDDVSANPPEPVRVLTTPSPEGEVHKFLLPVPGVVKVGIARADATLETESVVIPMQRRHETTHTLCVSSQVGCAMGCTFCETAQMGLIRSLTPAEIVQQWWVARHRLGHTVRNIVFMGMGEPLDNVEGVIGAIEVLTDRRGPELSMRRITVSTVGRLDGMAILAERVRQPGWRQLNLAVSVNAPNDEIRSRIMPVNRAMPLRELVRAMEAWPLRASGAICAEYVLIPGVNDAMHHADELAALLKDVRCCVNVIPYNPRRDSPWPAPSEESVWAFLARLESRGQFCKRRRTKGRDMMGACGQLGNERIRGRAMVAVSIEGSGR